MNPTEEPTAGSTRIPTRVSDMTRIIEMLDSASPATLKGPTLRIARFLAAIVRSATAGWDTNEPTATMIPCHRTLVATPCEGFIGLMLEDEADAIHWGCSDCGEQGVLLGWRDSFLDLSHIVLEGAPAAAAVQTVIVSDAEFAALSRLDDQLDAPALRVRHTARGGPGEDEVTLAAPAAWLAHFAAAVGAAAADLGDRSGKEVLEAFARRVGD